MRSNERIGILLTSFAIQDTSNDNVLQMYDVKPKSPQPIGSESDSDCEVTQRNDDDIWNADTEDDGHSD